MNLKVFLVLFLIVTVQHHLIFAQTKGRYIPTKYDTIKKVIPQQVYGNPKQARIADSIAKIQKEKELEEKRLKDMEEAEKTKKEKNKKGNTFFQKKANKEKETLKTELKKEEKTPEPLVPKIKETKPIIQAERNIKTTKNINNQIWTLQKCIDYAKANNLEVTEAELDHRYKDLLLQEYKNSKLPDLHANASIANSYGRNIDPVTNQFVSNNFNYSVLGLNSQTLLFGWFQKKYQVEKGKLDYEISLSQNKLLQDDIAMNIVAAYLRVLMMNELLKEINDRALKISNEAVNKKNINNDLEKINKWNNQTQDLEDSVAILEIRSEEQKALLQLKALLNLKPNENFQIDYKDESLSATENFYKLNSAESLYIKASQQNGLLQLHQLKMMSSQKTLSITKAMQLPQLHLFGNIGTLYSSNIRDITTQQYAGEQTTGYVNIAGTNFDVTQSIYDYETKRQPMFTQFSNHVRANIGLSLTMPLINGYKYRSDIHKAKIALVAQKIAFDKASADNQHQIYYTYEEASTLHKKYIMYQKYLNDTKSNFNNILIQSQSGIYSINEVKLVKNKYVSHLKDAIQTKYDLLLKIKMLERLTGEL